MTCDWQLYLHALYNLVSNAIKNSDKGGTIEIQLHLNHDKLEDQMQLRTVVINTGTTLPKSTVKRMNKELS
jgi:hypothetical protein